MNQTYKIGQSYFPKHPVAPSKTEQNENSSSKKFNSIFQEKIHSVDQPDLKFSVHAKQRLDKRGIKLDTQAIKQLTNAVNKAEQKGAKDSLILMNDLAFVVNVPNRVVITTVDDKSMKEHIFTNIDSAVIV